MDYDFDNQLLSIDDLSHDALAGGAPPGEQFWPWDDVDEEMNEYDAVASGNLSNEDLAGIIGRPSHV